MKRCAICHALCAVAAATCPQCGEASWSEAPTKPEPQPEPRRGAPNDPPPMPSAREAPTKPGKPSRVPPSPPPPLPTAEEIARSVREQEEAEAKRDKRR
jgi:hypothetical protein